MGLSQKIKMFTIRFFSVPVVTRFKGNSHVVSLLATRIPSAAWAVGQSSWGLANEGFFFPYPSQSCDCMRCSLTVTKEFGLHLSVSGTPVVRIHGL